MKEKILKIIKEEFKKDYLNEETKDFLKSFKDKSKLAKQGQQSNLDKQLGINTKLYEKYKDMNTFSKKQKRLNNSDYNQEKNTKIVKSPSKTLESKEEFIRVYIDSYTKKELYLTATAKKIKNRNKMTKEQLARAIEQTELTDQKKDSDYYKNKLELFKLWNKYYDKKTGTGTAKYLQEAEKYYEKKNNLEKQQHKKID